MSNNELPCSKCLGQHHPADECVNTRNRSKDPLDLARRFVNADTGNWLSVVKEMEDCLKEQIKNAV